MTDELKALSDAPCRVYVFAREDDGQIHGWEWREDIEDVDEVPSYIREDIHATAIEAARAEERERCAKVAEKWAKEWLRQQKELMRSGKTHAHREGMSDGADALAHLLRAGGDA